MLWSWVATVYAVWLTTQPYLLCGLPEHADTATCSSQYRTLFAISTVSLVALSLLLSLVVRLCGTGQTIRGLLSGTPPHLAVTSQHLAVTPQRFTLANMEARLGPVRNWWQVLVPGLGLDTSAAATGK